MGRPAKNIEAKEHEMPLITELLNLLTPASIEGLISATMTGKRQSLIEMIEGRFPSESEHESEEALYCEYNPEDNVIPLRADLDSDGKEEIVEELAEGEVSSSEFILAEKKKMERLEIRMKEISSRKMYGAAAKIMVVKREKKDDEEEEIDVQGKGLIVNKRHY